MQEMCIQSLGWEDPLEEEMATGSSILAWEIPWTGGTWWATVHRSQKVQYDLATYQQFLTTKPRSSVLVPWWVAIGFSALYPNVALPVSL